MCYMCYIIFDKEKNEFLYKTNGSLIYKETLDDCFDYIEYNLNRIDFDNFKFIPTIYK